MINFHFRTDKAESKTINFALELEDIIKTLKIKLNYEVKLLN